VAQLPRAWLSTMNEGGREMEAGLPDGRAGSGLGRRANRRLRVRPGRLGMAGLMALAVSGCGSSSNPGPPPATPAAQTTSTPATTASTPSSSSATAGSVTTTMQDSSGNAVAVTIGVGTPGPMSSSSDQTLAACDEEVTSGESTPAASIAIPITVTMQVTSSQSTNVEVNLSALSGATGGGNATGASSFLQGPTLWAGDYGGDPQCNVPAVGGGDVQWTPDVATPGVTHIWNAWLILPGVITPNDPSGLSEVKRLLMQAAIGLNGATPSAPTYTGGSNLVACDGQAEFGSDSLAYVAIDPAVALASGCRRP
jgi:hypothetical protein